jgi:signal transduction histidine kinase
VRGKGILPLFVAGAANAGAAVTIDQNMSSLVVMAVTTIGLVIAVINFIDKRIDHKIRNFEQRSNLQHQMVLKEIRHLREQIKKEP